jgi:hypothetical protein
VGLHHLCPEAESLRALHETAERLRSLDAVITDDPREFPEYRPGYNAVFFLDPDRRTSIRSSCRPAEPE